MSYSKRLRTTHSYIPSSYSESEPKEHDVFLSFRGEDTGNTFTDHLYQALVDKGISTFMDDEKIEIGKPISPELLLAIEKSSVAVIVLSRNYASSTWCLQELAKIIECMKEREMRVLPIFYHVDPSDVRNQTGTFADAFAKHEIRFQKNLEKVLTWRKALTEVANLSGRHLQNGRESEFIKTIVDSISRELSDTLSIVDEDSLIGIEYPVHELLYSHLQTWQDHEVRFIGLCGMSGIGKTTVARVVFQRIRFTFQACSFLDNVSAECNVDALLEKLLSDMKLRSEKEKWDASKGRAVIKNRLCFKKVLIVLDDVDKIEQLETLVGNCNWFGKGSRIIITTKDKHLLEIYGVPDENIYTVKGLNEYGDDLDLKLFCQKAFGKPDCEIDFLDLCKDFVRYASGHPLALKVLGSSLFGKGREVWQSARAKLKAIPNKDIQKKLQIGFDALEDTEKKLFLDIACFFNGDSKDRVIDLLEGLHCYPTIDIETLVDKSLLTTSGKRLWMHNLLQKMGWEVVRCEHHQNPGKWSRLWLSDDILHVLKKNTGTDNVESIMMNTPPHEGQLNANAFSNMKRLGLLKICNVHLPAGLEYLSNELHLMEWHEYPLTSMPNNFQPDNLVELIMPRCRFEQLPKGFRNLNKLKVLDLSDSQNLIKIPDFTGFSNLQRLILKGCTRLYEVHPSIGVLNQLVLLNLKDCQSLASLPYEINLESLKTVILSGCSSLIKFPEIGENMKRLSELYLDKTAIEEVPLSIQNLTGLTLLNLSGCKDHPSESWHSLLYLSALTSLVALDLSDCNLSDGAIPGDLSGLSSLEFLILSRNNFTCLPDSISQLSKLKFLYLDNCSNLKLLPNLPSGPQLVMERECSSLENCSNLIKFPEIRENIKPQRLPESSSSSFPSIRPSNHDVFLSFRGAHVRQNFVSPLYHALNQRGINIYTDTEIRRRGEEIPTALVKGIEGSKISIIVFSENYARSTWCLDELMKILDCNETMKKIVLPIFYDVNPSEVRHLKGNFGKSFDELGDRLKDNAKMLKWKVALKRVADWPGFSLENFRDESMLIESVVESVSRELSSDMASPGIETTPSSPFSSSKHRWKYEVFLSFRGETHDIFTSHLCKELREKFIYTFKDDDRQEIGRPIKKEVLLDAIDKSIMAVIIISKEYASSIWCLEELAKIVECMKDREMKVLPIFYHVDPSDVGKPDDTFRDAFAEHEKNIENKDKVQTWRNALKKVANLSGCHLKSGDEPMFIKEIVKMISRELINLIDDHEDNLVGIDSRVNEIHFLLGIGFNDVRIIGICGMSGMGKTTLARGIFQKFNHLFQAKSFLENVSLVSKRNGLVALQEKILSDMKLKFDQEKWDVLKGIDVIRNRLLYTKVLIVLDDVDEKEQLETLAGNCNWFGPGSRIIVTTRDECLLTAHGVQIIYRIEGLHEDEALKLFSQEAFSNPNQCEDQDFLHLCNDYVSCAGGHPLALKVLGSSLLGKGREVWKRSLNKIQVLRNRDIQQQLQIGFDALGETEQKMFLDIACFFNGEDKDRVVDLLEDSDCFPNIDIETLVDKSLVTILGNKLWMHSLLQRMGWEIVRCEHRDKPGKRSRLWHRDDIFKVLRENSGTCKVQGIMLSTSSTHQEEDLNPYAFSKMDNLRLIKLCDVNLPRGLNSLSNWLRLLEWHQYSLEYIPESFRPSNLVELIMHRSNFLQLPMVFLELEKLKVMDFSGSENLMMIPDLSGCPSLQKLIFEGCTRLYEVHPSIGALDQLILLNLKDCECLRSLPHEINLESLNLLILSGCSSFNKFPEIGQNMKLLSELYLDGTAVEELPLSIQHLTGLTLLHLGECKKLLVFPSDIYCLPALKTLILSGSTLPTTLSLLNSFSGLNSLVTLDLSDCNLLDGALLDNLSSLSSLENLNLSRNNFTHLPQSISQLPNLKFLCLDNTSVQNTSLQNYSNQVVVSTLAVGSISDDIKLRESSGVGSAHKRKMEDASGQTEWQRW